MKERFDKVKKEDFIIRIRPYIDKVRGMVTLM